MTENGLAKRICFGCKALLSEGELMWWLGSGLPTEFQCCFKHVVHAKESYQDKLTTDKAKLYSSLAEVKTLGRLTPKRNIG